MDTSIRHDVQWSSCDQQWQRWWKKIWFSTFGRRGTGKCWNTIDVRFVWCIQPMDLTRSQLWCIVSNEQYHEIPLRRRRSSLETSFWKQTFTNYKTFHWDHVWFITFFTSMCSFFVVPIFVHQVVAGLGWNRTHWRTLVHLGERRRKRTNWCCRGPSFWTRKRTNTDFSCSEIWDCSIDD